MQVADSDERALDDSVPRGADGYPLVPRPRLTLQAYARGVTGLGFALGAGAFQASREPSSGGRPVDPSPGLITVTPDP
jgi:hypothetical protein